MNPVRLSPDRFADTVEAFCDAFHDYPVMRYVIGEADSRYENKLRRLIGYFTESRFSRQYPVLGIVADDGKILAAANVNPARGSPSPPSLERAFEKLCASLGPEAMARYDAFADVCNPFEPEDPHVHLGMIGVIRGEQGNGHARRLLDAVHDMSRADPESSGVSLTTETSKNLPFYEHFGYRILGHGETPDGGLESWTLFRPDDA